MTAPVHLTIEPSPTLWHRQLFRVRFDAGQAKAVLIRYHNGNVKPWYIRTARSYRFRRWWWKKSVDTFINLANINRPEITFWIIRSWFRRPEKHTFILQVAAQLDLRRHNIEERLEVIMNPAPRIVRESKSVWKPIGVRVRETSIQQLSGVNLTPAGMQILPFSPPPMKGIDETITPD